MPSTALTENCDRWHVSDLADFRDGAMNSMAILRRNLVNIRPIFTLSDIMSDRQRTRTGCSEGSSPFVIITKQAALVLGRHNRM